MYRHASKFPKVIGLAITYDVLNRQEVKLVAEVIVANVLLFHLRHGDA